MVKSEVFLIDCMEYMKTMPDKYFDLAIVDPPYGIRINISMGRRKGDKKSNYKKYAGEDKSIPSADYFKELFRISKNQIIWGGNYMTDFLHPSPCWLLWDKKFSDEVTFSQFEMAWTSFDGITKKYESSSNRINRIHPTQKPVPLYEWIIRNYAKAGDKIFDSHLGSGSNRIACYKAGLDFVGCELDKDYYEAQEKRFEDFLAQGDLFIEKPVQIEGVF